MEIKSAKTVPLTIRSKMEHQRDYVICGIFGFVGGTGKILLQINQSGEVKFMAALATAFACGLVGAAGKWCFDKIVKSFSKKKTTKK